MSGSHAPGPGSAQAGRPVIGPTGEAPSGQEGALILVVEDDAAVCWALEQVLRSHGYRVVTAPDAASARRSAWRQKPDLVITDVRMPGESGLDLLVSLRQEFPHLNVVVTTAHGTVETAVEAVRRGAFDYLPKPLDLERTLELVRRALGEDSLAAAAQPGAPGESAIIGSTPAMQEVYRRIASAGGRGWDDLTPDIEQESYLALDDFLKSEYAPRRGDAVLDVGCGGGQAGLRVAKGTPGCRLFGVDYSETAVELARANAVSEGIVARFERRDAVDLGEIGPFDVVLDNHLLHCLVGPDRGRALAQIRHVLRPGGTLFLETMTCEGGLDAVGLDADPVTRVARNGSRFWVSREELEAELTRAGFVIAAIELRIRGGHTLVVWAR